MAGGPNAGIVACLHCFGPADRLQEGIEDDFYLCRDCGRRFGVDWSRGAPSKPCWPPTPEEQGLMDQLRARREAAGSDDSE